MSVGQRVNYRLRACSEVRANGAWNRDRPTLAESLFACERNQLAITPDIKYDGKNKARIIRPALSLIQGETAAGTAASPHSGGDTAAFLMYAGQLGSFFLAILLFMRPCRCSRSGCPGLTLRLRERLLTMLNSTSTMGLAHTKALLHGEISGFRIGINTAIQASQKPSRYAPPSPRNILPQGKLRTKNPEEVVAPDLFKGSSTSLGLERDSHQTHRYPVRLDANSSQMRLIPPS